MRSLRTAHGPGFTAIGLAGLLLAPLWRPSPALAHDGPPYPILVDRAVGPYTVSVWADPDVGTGTFYLTFEGGALPEAGVEVWTQPESGRLPEARVTAQRQAGKTPPQYIAETHFDAEEWWKVRFTFRGPAGAGELQSRVQVTPPGLGPWDLALYLAPFLVVAFFWAKAALRRKNLQPPA